MVVSYYKLSHHDKVVSKMRLVSGHLAFLKADAIKSGFVYAGVAANQGVNKLRVVISYVVSMP